ncbi:MAG: hypothetical protein AABY47_05630 [Pseudomonadota bacterium]
MCKTFRVRWPTRRKAMPSFMGMLADPILLAGLNHLPHSAKQF